MNQNLIDSENLQNDREKLKTALNKTQNNQKELHDIIYDFITEYSDGISLAIKIQDDKLLGDYIKDYLNMPIQQKHKTNGDVIRESNESLADFFTDSYIQLTKHFNEITGKEVELNIGKCLIEISDFLNQPIESEVNNG